MPETSASTQDAPIDTAGTTREDVERSDPPTWVRVLLNVVGGAIQLAALAGMLLAAFLLVRRLHTAWALRRVHEEAATGEFQALDDRRRVADAMAQDVGAQTRILEEGEPRNAIVECWHRFEVQAERAGLGRRPSETSSELALRMLDVADVDRAAVNAAARALPRGPVQPPTRSARRTGAPRSTPSPASAPGPGRSCDRFAAPRLDGPGRPARRGDRWSGRWCSPCWTSGHECSAGRC